MSSSDEWVLPFSAIGAEDLPRVGGKGANLGEMAGAGFPVPDGFCVTTRAYEVFWGGVAGGEQLWHELAALPEEDAKAAGELGERIRAKMVATAIPEEIEAAIARAWAAEDRDLAWAVRSSATAEDLPDASFAGQQDTYLNVKGKEALLDAIRRCWASLFTTRAILYRSKNGFDHKEVQISVVVQRMVLPEVSGIMFTADPVSGHRHHIVIEASYGLGEALVSGRVTPDRYVVDKRSNVKVESAIGDKRFAIFPLEEGGTRDEVLDDERAGATVLTDVQINALAELGKAVEAHYGSPQDTEWCLSHGQVFLVQARPITSLFPLVPTPWDDHTHLYFCFNHAQVMTDAMTPLGLELWRVLFPFGKRGGPLSLNRYLAPAGGRLYADITAMILHPIAGRIIPRMLSIADPIASSALVTASTRADVRAGLRTPGAAATTSDFLQWLGPILGGAAAQLLWQRYDDGVARANRFVDSLEEGARQAARSAEPGAARLKALVEYAAGPMPQRLFRYLPPFIAAGIISGKLLEKLCARDADPADMAAVTRAFEGNVTTEMDLAVADLADVARPHPAVVSALRQGEASLESLRALEGGGPFVEAVEGFLDSYGMRGPGEIDVGRPRWRDEPRSVLQFVVGNLAHDEVGEHRRHNAALRAEAEAAIERLAKAVKRGVFGGIKAAMVRRLAGVHRAMMAVREHPKFLLIKIFGMIRAEVLAVGAQMVKRGQLSSPDDCFMLSFEEIFEAADDPAIKLDEKVAGRRADLNRFQAMAPPKVLTSEGEAPRGVINRANLPEGALAGTAASAGVIEGVARVVLDPNATVLHRGEILVAPFTDPGWTPLFINAAGLVMEVGGMMTHGSVVAREYGIPAVVSVPSATTAIKTGQRVRVHGDLGYVQIIDDPVEQGAKGVAP